MKVDVPNWSISSTRPALVAGFPAESGVGSPSQPLKTAPNLATVSVPLFRHPVLSAWPFSNSGAVVIDTACMVKAASVSELRSLEVFPQYSGERT